LHSSRQGQLHLATRDSDGLEVVLRCYRTGSAREPADQAQREVTALRAAAGPGVPEVLDLLPGAPSPWVVMQRIDGVVLRSWLDHGPIAPAQFLEVSLQLAAILDRVHRAHWVHRELTPDSLMVKPATLEIHIVDLAQALRLDRSNAQPSASDSHALLGHTLEYIAPEQTGRMNRGVDARSDLYSLGAVLYLALTGSPPFESSDPLALIHAHMARMPRSPLELRPELPPALAQIVLKLLSKQPEDRYQTAAALRADLQACGEELAERGRIAANLEIGAAPDRPVFSDVLYDRDREMALLNQMHAEVSNGVTRAVLIRGPLGAGKTALATMLRLSIEQTGGYFALGRFEAHHERPYAGWTQALESLVNQWLVESDERLGRWKVDLRAGLGSIGRALCDLVPDLAFVLDDVPAVPQLGPRETQARLSLALQRLLRICGRPEAPLVVLLDDLQWSDGGSLVLLEELLSSAEPSALLLLGTYRSDEVDGDHPLTKVLLRLQQRHRRVDQMEIGGIASPAVVQMLAETLQRAPSEVVELADLVVRKTDGNPFLIREFVGHIHDLGLLCYEVATGWVWQADQIASAAIPDGAVALITAKIDRLDTDVCELLRLASCVGTQIDASILAELSGHAPEVIDRALLALTHAGLLATCEGGLRFAHERIRETVQSLCSSAERAQRHYDIGRLLLARTPEADRAERALEIAEHLNLGAEHVREELGATMVDLNSAAGRRALARGAVSTAHAYFSQARKWFCAPDWAARRAVGFDLYLQSAEAAFQVGDFDGALELLVSLDAHCSGPIDVVRIGSKRIQIYALTDRPEKSVRYALSLLRQFGLRWPFHPGRWRARLALLYVRWRLRGRAAEDVLVPAQKLDPHWLAPLIVLGQAGAMTVRLDVHLTALVSSFAMRQYIRRGYVGRVAFSLSSYACWYLTVLGDAPRAREFARSARVLSGRVPDPVYGPRGEVQLCGVLEPWLMPRRDALAPLEPLEEKLREAGDPEYAYYARFLRTVYLALAGDPIPASERRLSALADDVERSGLWFPSPALCHRTYRLLTQTTSMGELERALAQSDADTAAQQGYSSVYVSTFWMLVLGTQDRFDLVFAESQKVWAQLFTVRPFIHVADHTFYRGVAAAVLATSARGRQRRTYRRALRRSRRLLEGWMRGGPDFAHMAWLLEAEEARLRGHATEARRLYEKSSQRAQLQNFPHHAALAHERRAHVLIDLRRMAEAEVGLFDAARSYREWGCRHKVEQLTQRRRTFHVL